MHLSDFDLGWVVGIIEGEGCFVRYQDKRRPTTWSIKIQVESTDHDVILKLKQLLGGNIWESNYASKYKRFPDAKPSWRWAITNRKLGVPLLQMLQPNMSVRRQKQIQLLLDIA